MLKELIKLLKQIGVYGIGSVISPIIGIIMLPIYTRYLTPADYGLLALAGVFSMLLTTIISLRIDASLVRIYYSFNNKEDRDEVVLTAIIFSFISSSLFVGIMYLLNRVFSPILFSSENSVEIYNLVIFTIVFAVTQRIQLNILRSEERSVVYTIFSVAGLIYSFALNIIFVVVLEEGVTGILTAGLITNASSFLFLVPFTLKRKKISFSVSKLKEILNFGIPLIPSGIAAIALNLSDRYFIEYFHGTAQVGLYAIGYRIADFLGIVITKPFKTAWGVYMFKVADRPDTKLIYKNVLVYYFFIAIWAGLALSIFSKEGLYLITTAQYYEAYKVVPLITFSHILFGMMNILVAGIHLKKKTKYIAVFFVTGAVLHLILNIVLIPIWGIMGAAISTLLSFIYLNFTYFWGSQRLYPIDHEFKRLLKILAVAILLYLISLPISELESLLLSIMLKLVALFLFPVLLFAIKFYKEQEIKKILQGVNKIIKKKDKRSG